MRIRLGTPRMPRISAARISPRMQLAAIGSAALALAVVPVLLTLVAQGAPRHVPASHPTAAARAATGTHSTQAASAASSGQPTQTTTDAGKGSTPGGSTSGSSNPSGITPAGGSPSSEGGCVFESSPSSTPAFCDTFDAPVGPAAGTASRAGDLNGTVWGVSRLTGNQNPGQGIIDGWFSTQLNLCGQLVSVAPPNDVRICDGRLVEATNDGTSVTTLAMYPKQPFDIAGRTGTISFDVSDDSQGTHTAWPEIWYTDKPVPAPFTHGGGSASFPKDGFGVRLAAVCSPGEGAHCGPSCPGDNAVPVVSVDSAVIVHDYVGNDSFNGGSLQVVGDGCMTEPTQAGQLNHIELRVSVGQIDVYGTNASTSPHTQPLVHLATIPNVALSLTRGLVWLEDVHYNANKDGHTEGTHTFAWDNLAFDGPVLPRDAAYDAADNNAAGGGGCISLGWNLSTSSMQTLNVPGVTSSSISRASGALLTFNFWGLQGPVTFHLSINGHAHDVAWPYPAQLAYIPQTLAIVLPTSDVVAGTNTVTFTTDSSYGMSIFNVDLILIGGQGVVSP